MLPITKSQAKIAAAWMKSNYITEMRSAVAGTPFSVDHLCGIACQETAFLWLNWIDKMTADEVLGRCIGDASGDAPGTVRKAFPRNTAIFRGKYGDAITDMLIEEANKSRRLRGFTDRQWVYKGYGLYQYDLQHFVADEDFFRSRRWYSYDHILEKVMLELDVKFRKHKDIWKALKAYNGSGDRATIYANNVTTFTEFCKEVDVSDLVIVNPALHQPGSAAASVPATDANATPRLLKIAEGGNDVDLPALAFDRGLAIEIQDRLIKIGCLDPPADGVFGIVSNLSLMNFAKAAGVAEPDAITKDLAKSLLGADESNFIPLTLGNDFASRIVKFMQGNGYWIAKLPGYLNIVYVEGADADGTPNADRFNKFNDRRIVFAIENGKPVIKHNVLATTEPGAHYTKHPLNAGGAARIKFGQYKAWRVGTHKAGKPSAHEALVQVGDLAVHRDLNKDGFRTGDAVDVGSGFAINQHSGHDQNPNDIGLASAGCLVSQKHQDHRDFMRLVKTDPRYANASHGYKFISTIIAGDKLAAGQF